MEPGYLDRGQSRAVLAKLSLVVLAIGAGACALLTIRQLRIEAAHELASTRLRVLDHDTDLQRLRTDIAARVTPERVHEMAAGIGPLRQLQLAPLKLRAPEDATASSTTPAAAPATGPGARPSGRPVAKPPTRQTERAPATPQPRKPQSGTRAVARGDEARRAGTQR